MKQNLLSAICLASLFFQTACDVKFNADKKEEVKLANEVVNPFQDPRKEIVGVYLDGRWTSRCHVKPGSVGEHRILEMTFKSQELTRHEMTFSNSSCSGQPQRDVKFSGLYRFVEVYADGSYEAEYAFRIADGFQLTLEKILKIGNEIYISDFQVGPLGQVNRANPLTRTEGTDAPLTDRCVNYSGNWNMNGSYLRIRQEGCELIRWTQLPVFPTDVEKETVYILDGIERTVENVLRMSRVENKNWVNYIRSATAARKQVFTMEKRPCNLSNPDGQDYLTIRTFEGTQEIQCSSLARSR